MALTALQRTFLVSNLGVNPNRGFFDVGGKFTDMRLQGSVDEYLKQENEVIKQVGALRKIKGAEPFVLNIERTMAEVQKSVKEAQRDGGKDTIDDSAKKIVELNTMAKQVIGNPAFYIELNTAEEALKTLAADPQRAHIKPEIDSVTKDLGDARKLAGTGKISEARVKLGAATTSTTEGKRCATEYAAVMVVKASAARALGSMKGVYADNNVWIARSNGIDTASAKAETPTRNYATAKSELQVEIDSIKSVMTNAWVTAEPAALGVLKTKQTTLRSKSKDGTTIVDDDVQKVAEIRTTISDAVNAGKWPVAVLAARKEMPG